MNKYFIIEKSNLSLIYENLDNNSLVFYFFLLELKYVIY